MKFISLKEKLKQALNIASHLSVKNINLPILNNILFKANKNNEIELISTNLEIGIIYKFRSKVETEGEFTIDAKLFSNYINLLPGEKVEIENIDDHFLIKSDNYKTKIRGEVSDEFPLIPVIKKDKYCLIDIKNFKNSLTKVAFSAAINDNRIELTGVLFDFNKNNLTLVATDSYRLSEKKLKLIKNSLDDKKIIIPIKTIQEVLRILNIINLENLKELKIYLSDNQVLFNIDGIDIISRLVSGNYPDYNQIIPKEYLNKIEINREEFIRAVKTASLFTKTSVNDIILFFTKNNLNISSFSGQTGESSINLPIINNNEEENNITLNYRYLLEGLNNLNNEKIIFNLINSQTPCLLEDKDKNNYLYIIMPIRQ